MDLLGFRLSITPKSWPQPQSTADIKARKTAEQSREMKHLVSAATGEVQRQLRERAAANEPTWGVSVLAVERHEPWSFKDQHSYEHRIGVSNALLEGLYAEKDLDAFAAALDVSVRDASRGRYGVAGLTVNGAGICAKIIAPDFE